MAGKMTIGKKISIGFGIVLVALGGLAAWSILGVSGIVENASEVIDGNKLRAEMTQREVDHLNWANKLNELFDDPEVTELHVETDPHKCGFGKWYYSDARKQAEKLVPAIADPLRDIETWHNQLHASAEEIGECFCNADLHLSAYLERCKGDHLAWASHVKDSMLDKSSTKATDAVDPHKCNFGKWFYSDAAAKLRREWPHLNEIMQRIERPHAQLHESAHHLNDLLAAGKRDEAIALMNSETLPLAEKVCGMLDEAIEWNDRQLAGLQKAQQIRATKTQPALEHVQEHLGEIRDRVGDNVMTDEQMLGEADKTRAGTIVVSVIGIIAGISFAVIIIRSTKKALTAIAADLAEGSQQVSVAAEQVSGASQSLASGTSEQAASIEETTASVEEMTSQVKQTSDNAGKANTLAETAQQAAGRGTEAMERMSTAIGEIKNASDETAKIVKTIDEIAFQTNLLALNAAVEAARAGEAGKGFAVVAEEVRNLAQRSAEAARSTAEMIESSVDKANNGVQISKDVAEALASISEASGQVNELVAQIASASNEQSQGIEQINGAVTEMDSVTQSNAANAEETASAAEELSSQAEQLNFNVQQLQQLVYGQAARAGEGDFRAESGPKSDRPGGSSQGQANQQAQPRQAREDGPAEAREAEDMISQF